MSINRVEKSTGQFTVSIRRYTGGKLRITADVEDGGSIMVSAENTEGDNVVTGAKVTKSGVDMAIDQAIPANTKRLVVTLRLDRATDYAVGFGK